MKEETKSDEHPGEGKNVPSGLGGAAIAEGHGSKDVLTA